MKSGRFYGGGHILCQRFSKLKSEYFTNNRKAGELFFQAVHLEGRTPGGFVYYFSGRTPGGYFLFFGPYTWILKLRAFFSGRTPGELFSYFPGPYTWSHNRLKSCFFRAVHLPHYTKLFTVGPF